MIFDGDVNMLVFESSAVRGAIAALDDVHLGYIDLCNKEKTIHGMLKILSTVWHMCVYPVIKYAPIKIFKKNTCIIFYRTLPEEGDV